MNGQSQGSLHIEATEVCLCPSYKCYINIVITTNIVYSTLFRGNVYFVQFISKTITKALKLENTQFSDEVVKSPDSSNNIVSISKSEIFTYKIIGNV